jgi:hypothetical protein
MPAGMANGGRKWRRKYESENEMAENVSGMAAKIMAAMAA